MPMFAKIDPDVECIEGGEIVEYWIAGDRILLLLQILDLFHNCIETSLLQYTLNKLVFYQKLRKIGIGKLNI